MSALDPVDRADQTGRKRSATRARSRAAWVALVLGVLGLVAVLVGWLVAMSVGTVRDEDTTQDLPAGRTYVVGVSGQDVSCVVTPADGQPEIVTLGPGPRNVGLSLSAASPRFAPGGAHLAVSADTTLRCDGDVRVTTGAASLLSVLAENGLWVVVPSAALVALGSALRRTSRRA